MGFTRKQKEYIMTRFQHCIKPMASGDMLCRRMDGPQAWFIDGSVFLERAMGPTTGKEMFGYFYAGLGPLVGSKKIDVLCISFDNSFSVPPKDIAYKRRDKGLNKEPVVQLTITDGSFPTREQWRASRNAFDNRERMHTFLVWKFLYEIKKRKDVVKTIWIDNIYLQKNNFADSLMPGITWKDETTREGFSRLKIVCKEDGTIDTILQDNSMICEGELNMIQMGYMYSKEQHTSYVFVTDDGDMIPLLLLHREMYGNKNIYIVQRNKDKNNRAMVIDIQMMIAEIETNLFIHRHIVDKCLMFSAIIILGGNDFVENFCKGTGFLKLVQRFLTTDTTLFMRGESQITYNEEYILSLFHDFYRDDGFATRMAIRNAVWNLNYWIYQPRILKDAHRLLFDPYEKDSRGMALYGYEREETTGKTIQAKRGNHQLPSTLPFKQRRRTEPPPVKVIPVAKSTILAICKAQEEIKASTDPALKFTIPKEKKRPFILVEPKREVDEEDNIEKYYVYSLEAKKRKTSRRK
jgi:hypothetical protein